MHLHLPLKNWFVLYTRPKYEKKISYEMQKHHYENYLPLRTTLRKWADRLKKIEEPLFPNYLFVKITLNERNDILATDGVVRFVSFGGKPVVLGDTEIVQIQKLESLGKDIKWEEPAARGERVRVTRGLLAGYEGEMVQKSKASRLLVKLAIFKQPVSVEISAQDVELIA